MLKIKNLHVSIDGNEILRGIDLDLEAGKTYAIMGPNGSGKSTLSYVLAGSDKYTITDFEAFNHARDKEAWENSFLYKVQKFFKKILSNLFGSNNKGADASTRGSDRLDSHLLDGVDKSSRPSAPSLGSVKGTSMLTDNTDNIINFTNTDTQIKETSSKMRTAPGE